MNKSKKIAVAAVSVVMAGTMVFSLAGCKKPSGGGGNKQGVLAVKTDSNGKLTWAENTNLNVSVGHNAANLGAAYDSTNIKLLTDYLGGTTAAQLYGKSYAAGNFKPAWAALADQLKVKFTDKYTGKSSDNQLSEIKNLEGGLASVDIFTSSAQDLNNEASTDNEAILNLTNYLEYMPNYKAFLNSSATTKLSLTADTDGSMYLAPYFDGNDDIEKYVLIRKDLVEKLLNSTGDLTGTVTFSAQAGAKSTAGNGATASVKSFMGTTGHWEIAVTDPSVLTGTPRKGNDKTEVTDSSKTITITVDYDKALADAKSSDADTMGAILANAGVSAADIAAQTSGNIIDIMNLAINKKAGNVDGNTLTQLLKRYITVTYIYNNESFYTTGGRKLAEVFNSAYAAWDADLYTALGRCFVTSGTALGSDVKETKDLFLLTGRQSRTDRFNDTVAMAGELYGVRGLESRYQYAYVKADGNIVDARTKAETYEALDKMNALTQEGLYAPLVSSITVDGGKTSYSSGNTGVQALTLHDYVQTQTAYGLSAAANNPYNFAPILTPVSQWDTDDNGSHETVMRFTESWRSVKTTGFGISYKGVKDSPDKLSAALAFVDYMFSTDGQILMTYGPQTSANDNGSIDATKAANGGFWYANEQISISPADVATKIADATNYAPAQWEVKDTKDTDGKKFSEKYFVYNDKVYTGTFYNGRQIPTMTASSMAMFRSGVVGKNNFTNYARYIIGTTLPIGNKDQGFEYQCTAPCGLDGADIVAIALNNDTIKHPVQQTPHVTDNELSDWYTLVPVTLFYDSDVLSILKGTSENIVTGMDKDGKHLFTNSSSSSGNFFHDIMAYGLGSNHVITLLASDNKNLPANAAGCVEFLNNEGKLNYFNTEMNKAFQNLVGVYVKPAQ
ncbi:MAG: hypothetical protein K2O41_00205 [Clostridia bacterium]|nr:hypothetical protein [Clostridia bacterium]